MPARLQVNLTQSLKGVENAKGNRPIFCEVLGNLQQVFIDTAKLGTVHKQFDVFHLNCHQPRFP